MKAWLAALLLLWATLAAPVHGQGGTGGDEGPSMTLLSAQPQAGDYTMAVRVEGFTLTSDRNDTAPDHGMIRFGFLLDDVNSTTLTTQTTHFFRDLKTGDLIGAELTYTNGTGIFPPVIVFLQVKSPVDQVRRPSVAVTSTTPNAGDYRMTVQVRNFTLVPVGSGKANDPFQGHLRYLRNGAACAEACATGQSAETTQLAYTFHGAAARDVLAAELVNNDGTSFNPPVKAVQVVAVPAVLILTSAPRAATSYVMEVKVVGFTLVAPTQPAAPRQAGTGHVQYVVMHEGGDWQAAPGNSATASTAFTFTELKEGDQIGAELVQNDGAPLSPRLLAKQDVLSAPAADPLAPGVGPVLAVALLAAALVARRRLA